ncbi:MAG: hypothetical protein HOC17_03680 [Candidatus Ruthia sp.]|jgi:hypothetical protein|nr:hypothetical protein [Candidatus Ruthturnera sp.]
MFDLKAEDLFFHVKQAMGKYQESKSKSIEQLFFIIMGLNHLREWIAPGYKYDRESPSPVTKEHKFFVKIYNELPEFKTINASCNGIKHLESSQNTDAKYGLKIDDWGLFDDVQSFDDGPPSKFTVDGVDIEIILKKVIDFYSKEWFDKNI